ncbi:MAG: hypothetical protein IJ774_05955, partial [Selenomonadaceae bacterium]|nr:hypothetical protein [Selenomonadaceae bacterium]
MKFIVDGTTAALAGVSGINGTESVSGALDGLKFNGGSASLAIGTGNYTVYGSGLSLAGLTT